MTDAEIFGCIHMLINLIVDYAWNHSFVKFILEDYVKLDKVHANQTSFSRQMRKIEYSASLTVQASQNFTPSRISIISLRTEMRSSTRVLLSFHAERNDE